jgi:zinc/manganese transport system substrate-binding protein
VPILPRLRAAAGAAIAAALAGVVALGAVGCATTAPRTPGGTVVTVVAAESFWGGLAAQLGGAHAQVTTIIDNPDADPHDYEPVAADARDVAFARLVIVNGVGYDAWASKLVDANPSAGRVLLTVGDLVGARNGDNPHRWYNPGDVRRVVDRITDDLSRLDPADAGYFATRHDTLLSTELKPYFDTIAEIRANYAGTPVGASESIFAMLAPALGLNLLTPPALLTAISEGSDPTARDKSTVDRQLRGRQIKVYVYNSQNATPDVRAQVDLARSVGIPVTAITETPTPAGASFADWQVAQLAALEQALGQATGK